MRKKFLITGTLVALAFELLADFPVDFQEAKSLFSANKNKEARDKKDEAAASYKEAVEMKGPSYFPTQEAHEK